MSISIIQLFLLLIIVSPVIPALGLISKRHRSAWLVALAVTVVLSLGVLAFGYFAVRYA